MKKSRLLLIALPLICAGLAFPIYKGALGDANTAPAALFANYTTWTNTMTVNVPPTHLMTKMAAFNSNYLITPNKFTFADLNGDNLPDFLYHQKSYSTSPQFYAVFFNNGNNNFNLADTPINLVERLTL